MTPKKPIDFGNEAYLCPNCRRNNFYNGTETLNKMDFCDFCGQALDWSDYDSKDESDYKYLVGARVVKGCVNDKAFEILNTEQQGNNDKEVDNLVKEMTEGENDKN